VLDHRRGCLQDRLRHSLGQQGSFLQYCPSEQSGRTGIGLLKGTVSPDITFYFRFCKIKSVLSVRPLRALNFSYFVVLEIFKYTF
jgi:hypothetical protein